MYNNNTNFDIEEDERPYICNECGFACRTEHGLEKHSTSYCKKLQKPNDTDARPYPCSECGYGCRSDTGLAKHKLYYCKKQPKQSNNNNNTLQPARVNFTTQATQTQGPAPPTNTAAFIMPDLLQELNSGFPSGPTTIHHHTTTMDAICKRLSQPFNLECHHSANNEWKRECLLCYMGPAKQQQQLMRQVRGGGSIHSDKYIIQLQYDLA